MSDSTERTDVVVVGAGLAGLAAARLMARAGQRVVVLDPHPVGGRARTDAKGGYLLNLGPHAVYRGGAAERVLTALQVPLDGAAPPAGLFGVRHGEVGVLPSGARTLLATPFLGWRGRMAVGATLQRLPKVDAASLAGRSVDDWLGALELPADAEALLRMLTRVATYSHAPSIAAADMVVQQLQLALGPGVRYLHGGWQTMVSALADGVEVRRVAVTTVHRDGRDVVVVTDERSVVAAAAVVAVASPVQAATLVGSGPFQVGPPVEAACLDLATSQRAARGLLLGVDEPLYCSDHGAAAKLAPAGGSVVHAARYLAPGEQHEPAATRAQLEAHACAAGVEPQHVVEARYLHRMTVAGALAVAEHGGLRGRPGVDASGQHGVFLAGDWVGPEGHLLDASLASAEAAARAAVRVAAMVGR